MPRKSHGESKTPSHPCTTEYRIWGAMIRRCECPRDTYFERYGGRGIRVCDRWRRDYPAFLADMGRRPSLRHSLDRINNDGNYEPGNCRWATEIEQAKNTSRAQTVVEFEGVSHTLRDWAAIIGLHPEALRKRLFDLEWSVAEALTTPPRHLLRGARE